MTNGPTSANPVAPRTHAIVPGAWLALSLLICINIFNFVDRQVLAAVEPEVQREFFPERGEMFVVGGAAATADNLLRGLPPGGEEKYANFMMGILAFAFLATYTVTAPIFGWLAGRMNRWVLVGVGVGMWSLASGASGLTRTFWLMLLTRCAVGIGEAVYGPVAPDVISDLFPVSRRGQVLSWFYAAIPVGGALGYALGEGAVLATGDWRWAFYLVVPPGLLLTVVCFFMKEPPRGLTDGVAHQPLRRARLSDYKILFQTPSYVLNCLGMAAMSFAIGGLAYWMPALLEERQVAPLFGVVPPKTAFGGLTVLSGLFATLLGGVVGDRLKPYYSGSYFLVSGAALVLAAPLVVLVVWLPFPLAWIALVACVFCLFFNTGPTNAVLANVTHPQMRAAAFALNILVIHLLGDAPSPMLMGLIRDHSPLKTLDYAFDIVSVTALIGGALWIWGARFLERDTLLAPTRLGESPGKEVPYPPAKGLD
jgi:MFS family permease